MVNSFNGETNINALDVAVIGMSCAFPKAGCVDEFWKNLCNGVNSVRFMTDEELIAKGVPPEVFNNPNYVKATSDLENIEYFDADFFGINPNEAKGMDPQQRKFLECCWEALEYAGYDPAKYDKDIGVFAGSTMNTYLSDVLTKNSKFIKSVNEQQIMIGNDKDFLTTIISYKLNLRGPSVSINTGCSTALVSIHFAKNSLLLRECDMALAGGVSIVPNYNKGYMYMKDGFQSPDGFCRAFDEDAKGTIWGEGCGVVLLKRLQDAVNDRDNILAVIKGSAVNNDGSNKVGYTAPGVDGQSKVIAEALAVANLSSEEINYIETHGTGTQLGDLVEISALTQVFQAETEKKGFCPIGSVKTNIGHLGSAAGISSFIKTVLALKNKKLPPSLNFKKSNPKIELENTPFYVNNSLVDWESETGQLRAGISSMGIGGTNCHIVLEESPAFKDLKDRNSPDEEQILVLSARTPKALEKTIDNLAVYLKDNQSLSIEDIAYTLQCGRHEFAHRTALRAKSVEEAVAILEKKDPELLIFGKPTLDNDNSVPGLWLRGEEVDWQEMWSGKSPCRVQLPTYPFERKRYWVEPDSDSNALTSSSSQKGSDYYKKRENIEDWFYLPVWKPSVLPINSKKTTNRCWWVFSDILGISNRIVEKLKSQGDRVIVMLKGMVYRKQDEECFIFNPADSEEYTQVVNTLMAKDCLPDGILYLWSIGLQNKFIKRDMQALISCQENGAIGVVNLVKSLSSANVKRQIKLFAITNNLFDVLGNEELNINSSTMLGICTVVQQEFEKINSSLIDITLPYKGKVDLDRLTDVLVKEINDGGMETVCAYRRNRRFVRSFEALQIKGYMPLQSTLDKEGVILVYNGASGVPFTVLRHVLKNKICKILILEEKGFPKQESWQECLANMEDGHPIAERIKGITELIGLGAEYVGTLPDLAGDPQILNTFEKRIGKLTGVIQYIDLGVEIRSPLLNFNKEIWCETFKSLDYSLNTLDEILKDRKLDFRILMNGLVSILGGFGSGGVSALGNYAKAFSIKQSRDENRHWSVQNWDGSEVIWEKIRQYMPAEFYGVIENIALTEEEGVKCFERALMAKDTEEIAISATNLNNRYNRWVKADSIKKESRETRDLRPDIATPYVAPESITEKLLEEIFSDLLGIEKLGVNDDFFELGGHSLLGVQLVTKLRDIYGLEIDLPIIYQNPTIGSLSTQLGTIENNRVELV